jgi:hypothetical protein
LFGDVRLDTEVDQRQVLDSVGGRVEAPNHTEALACVYVAAELEELRTKRRERKVGRLHEVSILIESCPGKTSAR